MTELIAVVGAVAAISQLARYGLDIARDISGFTHQISHEKEILRRYDDQAAAFVECTSVILSGLSDSSEILRSQLYRCRDDVQILQNILRKIAVTSNGQARSKIGKKYRLLLNGKDLERHLQSIRATSTSLSLHQITLSTMRIEQMMMPPNRIEWYRTSALPNARAPCFPSDRPRCQTFVGRGQQLQYLEHLCLASNFPACMAIAGPAGSGKTELVTEFAFRFRESRPGITIFWLDGHNEVALELRLLQIISGTVVDLGREQSISQAPVLRASAPLLIIIDNADVQTFYGSAKLHRLLSRLRHECMLILTRDRDLALKLVRPQELVEIDKMDPGDAQRLIAQLTSTDDKESSVRELASFLDHSPLALSIASQMIKARRQSVQHFLSQLYFDNSILMAFINSHSTLSSNFLRPAQETIRSVSKRNLCAQRFLEVLCYFGPRRIPYDLILRLGNARIVAELQRHALLKTGSTPDTMELDAFTRAAIKTEWSAEVRSEDKLHSALTAMCAVYPRTISLRSLRTYRSYQSHIKALLDIAFHHLAQEATPAVARLVASLSSRLCTFLLTMCRYKDTKCLTTMVLNWIKNAGLNKAGDHAALQIKLAISEQYSSDHEHARRHYSRVVWTRHESEGQLDRITLQCRNNMGLLQEQQGHFAEAETSHRNAYYLKRRVYGKVSQSTLRTLNNLGKSLIEQRRYGAAERLFRRVLSDRLSILAPNHPEVLDARSNLGVALQLLGKTDEAEKLHLSALNSRSHILGDNHPETWKSKCNLAIIANDRGNFAEAEATFWEALPILEETYSPTHPEVLRVKSNLAMALHDQDKFPEAEELMVAVVQGRESTYGKQHPDTIEAVEFLAILLHWQRKLVEALRLEVQVFDWRVASIGRLHADSRRSIEHIEELHRDMGQSNANVFGATDRHAARVAAG